MKKYILAMVATLFSVTLIAADYNWKGFHVGATVEGNLPFIVNQLNYGSKELAYKVNIAPAFGVSLGYNFNTHVAAQLQLSFTKQGQSYDETIENIHYTREVEIHYTHIPLLFKYLIGTGRAQGYVMLGPDLALRGAYASLLHANGVTTDQKANPNPSNGGDLFTRTDFGLNFSIGTNIMLGGNVFLNAGFEMYYGFTDINAPAYRKDYPKYTYGKSTNFYGGINVGIHYLFNKVVEKDAQKTVK